MSRAEVVVVGFGVTGRAVAKVLGTAGTRVTALDDAICAEMSAAAESLGVDLGPTPPDPELERLLRQASMVVPSPGVPVSHPVLAAAVRARVPVRSEIELGYRRCRSRGRPRLVAVTGTNGKTTVTSLVTAALRASGVGAMAAGNIGVPLIEAAESEVEVCVAEVSSFQLQFTEEFRPQVSCWLNLAEDHLDWHPDMEHYAAAKARIWANQGEGDIAVVNADDPLVCSAAASVPPGVRVERFSIARAEGYRVEDGRLVMPSGEEIVKVADLPRALPHDLANGLAAAAVALGAGATPEACRSALSEAPLLPHRVSLVGSQGGVDWYDDSKATTPASVLAAVSGFRSVILIAGGRNKGLDLAVLGNAAPPVRAVVAIGEAAGEVAAAFAGRAAVSVASTMEEAVGAARALARSGDAVLLSPGCASFDWYRSYAERGDHFAELVRTNVLGKEAPC